MICQPDPTYTTATNAMRFRAPGEVAIEPHGPGLGCRVTVRDMSRPEVVLLDVDLDARDWPSLREAVRQRFLHQRHQGP